MTSPVLGALKWIPAGTFTMGSPSSEEGRDADEVQHQVTLSSGFWMMEREVTQGMWRQVMGSNPSKFTSCGDGCPVEQVSWTDAVDFAKRLSAQEGVSYRLPTEAEWEVAARGGASTPFAGGNEAASVGWVESNGGNRTRPGCEKPRNGYGLCDMTGNVWEWAGDWYGDYPTTATTHPMGPQSGSFRVFRGGGWGSTRRIARVADRHRNFPSFSYDDLGFRLVTTTP